MMRTSRSRGFTLLEVLVAITVFAVIAAGVYRVLSAMVETQDRVVKHADAVRELQRAMWIMSSDIEQVVMRDVRADYNDRSAAMVSDDDGFLLQFTRQGLRNPLLFNRSDLMRVAYSLDEEPDAENDSHKTRRSDKESRHLIRHVWGAVDRIDSTPVDKQILLHDVEEVELTFLNDEKEWEKRWPKKKPDDRAHVRELPVAVKIRLKTRQFGEITRIFQLGNVVQKKHQEGTRT
jgi:general secretion pathway protein J